MLKKYSYEISISFFNKDYYQEHEGTIHANSKEEAADKIISQYDTSQVNAIIINNIKEISKNDTLS